jgi:hypothetical protein
MLRKRIAIDLGTPHRAYLLPNTMCLRRKGAFAGQAANTLC